MNFGILPYHSFYFLHSSILYIVHSIITLKTSQDAHLGYINPKISTCTSPVPKCQAPHQLLPIPPPLTPLPPIHPSTPLQHPAPIMAKTKIRMEMLNLPKWLNRLCALTPTIVIAIRANLQISTYGPCPSDD